MDTQVVVSRKHGNNNIALTVLALWHIDMAMNLINSHELLSAIFVDMVKYINWVSFGSAMMLFIVLTLGNYA